MSVHIIMHDLKFSKLNSIMIGMFVILFSLIIISECYINEISFTRIKPEHCMISRSSKNESMTFGNLVSNKTRSSHLIIDCHCDSPSYPKYKQLYIENNIKRHNGAYNTLLTNKLYVPKRNIASSNHFSILYETSKNRKKQLCLRTIIHNGRNIKKKVILLYTSYSNITKTKLQHLLLYSKASCKIKIVLETSNQKIRSFMLIGKINDTSSSLFKKWCSLVEMRPELIKTTGALASSSTTFLCNIFSQFNKSPFNRLEYNYYLFDNLSHLFNKCFINKNEIFIQIGMIVFLIKTDKHIHLNILSEAFQKKGSFFKVSPALANYIAQDYLLIFVQLLSIENNGWSGVSRKNSVKHILSLSIQVKGEEIEILHHPVDLYFKCRKSVDKEITKGFVPVIHSKGVDSMDKFISVHKLRPLQLPGSGKVMIKFYNMSTNRFKVLLLPNVRPDSNMMNLLSKEVSYEFPLYVLELTNQTRYHINYLGIASSKNSAVPIRRVPYYFEVKYIQCYFRFKSVWSTNGCHVGNETKEDLVHCQCWHLSLFGASVAIAPKELDLENDTKLLLNVNDNPKPLFALCSLILLYFMVLVWTRHNDSKDRLQRYVIVLEDNFPGEEIAYLVTVYTGFWIGSGTDANLGLRLYGSKGISRIHNLQSRKRKVLKGNSDDWFLMFTPTSLGDIEKIHVFHDYTGYSPDWYCANIMVYDLENQKDYKFIVNKWISLSEEDEYIECYVEPTPTSKSLRRDRIALDNVMFGLRETHLLISIFTRHPRSSVTRSQRLSVCVCIIIVHMLTSIMFYKLEEVEFPQYSNHKRNIIIGIESTLLASPFTFIIIFCFKKSRIVMGPKKEVPMTLTSTQAVPLETGLEANQSKSPLHANAQHSSESSISDTISSSTTTDSSELEGDIEEEEEVHESCWRNCYKQVEALLFQVIITKTVMPVKIAEEDEESAHVRKQWMYFAWILCETTIFVSAFFVVIYGLKMDQKSTNEWLFFSFKNSFTRVILLAPMKIIIFATILAILYGQLQYVPSYECNTETAMKKDMIGNPSFLAQILKTRRSAWYHPLYYKTVLSIRRNEKNWRRWKIIINFTVVLLLYITLMVQVLMNWDGLYIPTRRNIQNIFDIKKSTDKVKDFGTYLDYLRTVVMPALSIKYWYNGDMAIPDNIWKQKMGFTKDYSGRLMSYPRIRQQRVIADSCNVPSAMSKMRYSQCNAPMNWFNMDKKDYSLRWTHPEKTIFEPNSPWIFSNVYNTPIVICGPTTGICYLPGGYTMVLHYNLTDSFSTLQKLFESEWLDGQTRAIFVDLLILNVNSDFISYVNLMLEKLAGGSFHFSVKTHVLHPRPSGFLLTFSPLIMFTLYYFFRLLLLFNRLGLKYLLSWTGLLDVFLNLLMVVTMINLCLLNQARTGYLVQWHLEQEEDLKMPYDIFLYRDLIRYETAILVIIIPTQLLRSSRFGKHFFFFYKSLQYCLVFTFGLAFIITIYAIGFDLIRNLNNNQIDVLCSFSRCFSPITHSQVTKAYSHIIPTISLPIFFCFILNVTTFLAAMTVIYNYKGAKLRYDYWDNFNIISFIVKKVKRSFKKALKIKRKVTRYANKRLKAGANEGVIPSTELYHRNKSISYTTTMCKDINIKFDVILKKVNKLKHTF